MSDAPPKGKRAKVRRPPRDSPALRENALEEVWDAAHAYRTAQLAASVCRKQFATKCAEAQDRGAKLKEIGWASGYVHQRISQLINEQKNGK